eukprot:m.64650 g.64650  ORF g.64650 m.64650 type:complete len:671 (-) comp23458_c0_seq2:116-2128(-)
MFPVVVAIIVCSKIATAIAFEPNVNHDDASHAAYHHLRSVRDIPFPKTLGAAADLHTEAMRRSRLIERRNGHVRHHTSTPITTPALPYRPLSSVATSTSTNSLIIPTDYGADPTGATDSSVAMGKAMAALLSPRGPGHTMASNITDLGGATLDLSGGTYLISEPLVIPSMYGNVQIVRGTLRASSTFDQTRFLVEIGSSVCRPKLPSGESDVQGSCGQFINMNEMMFDAAHVAAGGVKVSSTMGTTIGPAVFFTGFTTAGVQINGGHECMIQQAWFAECEWSDARGSVCQEDPDGVGGNKSKSVGIQINGNDHFVTDVIVFEFTHIGVEVNGAANLLTGVHTWNAAVYNHGGYSWKNGVGIAINAYQNRLVACYLDYSSLSVVDPSNLVVEATFFLAAPAVFISKNSKQLTGVQMHHNTFACGESIRLDDAFVDGVDCVISEDIGSTGPSLKTTKASKTVSHFGTPVTEFVFSFPELLLPQIEQVVYSFTTASEDESWVGHRALRSNGTTVIVQTTVPVKGQVTMHVSQAVHGLPQPPEHWSNVFSGLCLDTNNHYTSNGTPVNVWTCVDDASNEMFKLDSSGHFIGQNSLKCLSTSDCQSQADVCIQACTASSDNLWEVVQQNTSGVFSIHPKNNSAACLQAQSPNLASLVSVGICSKPLTKSQLWSLQ